MTRENSFSSGCPPCVLSVSGAYHAIATIPACPGVWGVAGSELRVLSRLEIITLDPAMPISKPDTGNNDLRSGGPLHLMGEKVMGIGGICTGKQSGHVAW